MRAVGIGTGGGGLDDGTAVNSTTGTYEQSLPPFTLLRNGKQIDDCVCFMAATPGRRSGDQAQIVNEKIEPAMFGVVLCN